MCWLMSAAKFTTKRVNSSQLQVRAGQRMRASAVKFKLLQLYIHTHTHINDTLPRAVEFQQHVQWRVDMLVTCLARWLEVTVPVAGPGTGVTHINAGPGERRTTSDAWRQRTH